eukprot:TRINITY_DN7460_c0_g1_i1.p1 TRINITY_DN7460_c0_g1~~TRINITY_DN7460_c0_g1_i1.p1  ORF type:complete len:280 (-),score=48.30 TRINITY_DN7460_c0_g1_i1:105-944(-)
MMESGESVYNLIPKPQETASHKIIYRSKLKSQVPPSCSTFGLKNTTKLVANQAGVEALGWDAVPHGGCHIPKKHYATFGREVLPTVDPRSFVQKGSLPPLLSAAASRPADGQYQRPLVAPRKAPVVRREEKPVMGLVTEKNFVVSNAVDVITQPAKRPKELEPLSVQNQSFGTVPKYLRSMQLKLAAQKQQEEAKDQDAGQSTSDRRLLSEEEKYEMLQDLKHKWDEAHRQYQSLTFNIDTFSKVERKERLEVEMEVMEKNMHKLHKKHTFIKADGTLI